MSVIFWSVIYGAISEMTNVKKRTIKLLAKAEEQTLIDIHRNHIKTRMRERAHMILLSNQGRSIRDICSLVYRSENTVAAWLNAYEREGFLGLYDKPIPGRPSKVKYKQYRG